MDSPSDYRRRTATTEWELLIGAATQAFGETIRNEIASTRTEQVTGHICHPEAVEATAGTRAVDAIIVHHDPPTTDGIATCRTLAERVPDVPRFLVLQEMDSKDRVLPADAFDVLTDHVWLDQPQPWRTLRTRLQRAIEHRRATQQELFYQAVEHAGHSIVITDADGTILYVNPAFEEASGYDAAEAVGETPRILKSGVHDTSVYEMLWTTIQAGDVWTHEITNERKTGERYIVDQTIAPVCDDTGAPKYFVAVNQEVTERRQREQRLSVLNRVLRHNLRNEAAVIQGYADELAEHVDEHAQEFLAHVRTSATQLDRIGVQARQIDTLLSQSINTVPIDPAELLTPIVNRYREQANVTIAVECPPDHTVCCPQGRPRGADRKRDRTQRWQGDISRDGTIYQR